MAPEPEEPRRATSRPDGQRIEEYSALVDLARHSRQAFARQISTAVHHVDEGVLVVAVLQDTWHDMRMAILVDPDKREIADIRAVMLRYPFHTCPESPEAYRRLVGLKLFERGTLKRAQELVPRAEGCTHLFAVFEACLRALFIGGGRTGERDGIYAHRWSRLDPEIRRSLNMRNPALAGSCHSFSIPPSEIPAEIDAEFGEAKP